jgi:hypothetical protein
MNKSEIKSPLTDQLLNFEHQDEDERFKEIMSQSIHDFNRKILIFRLYSHSADSGPSGMKLDGVIEVIKSSLNFY